MWLREWIWQTNGWVTTTSIAVGLVATIFWCSCSGSSASFM